MSNKSTAIIVEQEFNVSSKKLWDAITQLDQMTKWFFDNIPAFQASVGFETMFNVKTPNKSFLHHWKIIEVIPGSKIVYDWSYKEYSGKGIVNFEIFGNSSGSLLRVTSEGMDTLPQDIPEFTRESCVGGWTYFINERLKNYMETI